jgi:PAS domain-containing protein
MAFSGSFQRGDSISAAKPIQIILARQLASSLAMAILIVDTEGTLIYYNEPAEVILGQHYDETGEMPADEWSKLFAIADEERNPIPQEARPTMLALSERRPFFRTVWMRCGEREWKHISITAFPLIGEGAQFLGAQMIFWEV